MVAYRLEFKPSSEICSQSNSVFFFPFLICQLFVKQIIMNGSFENNKTRQKLN